MFPAMRTSDIKLRQWIQRFISAASVWKERNHANEAAALAFYSLFSLIPILLIGLFVASLLVGKDTATDSLLEQTNNVTGFSTSAFLQASLSSDLKWASNAYSPILGALVLAFSATKVINELRRALSNIFGNPPRHKKRRHEALANLAGRAISLVVILTLGFLIASSVIYESIIANLKEILPESTYLLNLINYLSPIATFAAMTFLATVIMRWLPKRPPRLKEAMSGGLICSTLIVLLKYGLMIFLRHANISDFFGGALTLVLLLLWIYFAMQAILYSAELSAILAKERRLREDDARLS